MRKRLIAHRGNVLGREISQENTIPHIERAIDIGFECEIDIWKMSDGYVLGHDAPETAITKGFLNKYADDLWIHCKNKEALLDLYQDPMLNVFWHDTDYFTLTSKGYIWAYPGVEISTPSNKAISVLFNEDIEIEENFAGYCSNMVFMIRDKYALAHQ